MIQDFVAPSFTSSIVQERMMRINLEAIQVKAYTSDELYNVVIKTLKEDFKQREADIICLISDTKTLFGKQLEASPSKLFYTTQQIDGSLKIFKCKVEELVNIIEEYTHGILYHYTHVPFLYTLGKVK